MELIEKITLAIIFAFFKFLSPLASLETKVRAAKKAVIDAEKAVTEAEKANDLKRYKAAKNDLDGSKKVLETAEKALKDAETPKTNDLIQLAVRTAVFLNIPYTQKDILDLGATSAGQFGYYKRSDYWMSFFGFTFKCDELKKAIVDFAKTYKAN